MKKKTLNSKIRVPVTVIIPCYNSAETIIRAVNSVLAQTALPSELIIIDDCSTDRGETIRLINEIVGKENQGIQLQSIINKKNVGPASSRNIGWELGTQPFLAFLDSDDMWHPQKIELQYQWMIANPKAVISSHRTAIYKDSKDLKTKMGPLLGKPVEPQQLLWSNPFCTRGVILRKELPFRFLENMYYAEDFFLWAEIVCSFPRSCYVLNCKLAFSFKNDFDSGGLSSNLSAMESGELTVIAAICKRMGYSCAIKYKAYIWSIIKYIRRIILSIMN